MADNSNRRPELAVIEIKSDRSVETLTEGTELFPRREEPLLLIVKLAHVSASLFVESLQRLRPFYVFDFRVAPRFAYQEFDRSQIISFFRAANSEYVDFFGRVHEAKEFGPAELATRFGRFVSDEKILLRGPIIAIVEDRNHTIAFAEALTDAFSELTRLKWHVRFDQRPSRFEEKTRSLISTVSSARLGDLSEERELIFISHANPEQNDFVTWLSAKLALLGYKTWCDVKELVGGELFWDEIERILRERTVKVIFVQSKYALRKPNVLNEIDLALSLERAHGADRFVIPIRVDETEFDRTYIGLRRRLIIDFTGNWSAGLANLVERLERDSVPRQLHSVTSLIEGFDAALHGTSTPLLSNRTSILFSNWFEFSKLPEVIRFFAIDGVINTEIPRLVRSLKEPCFQFHRLIGTFSSLLSLQASMPKGIVLRLRAEIKLDDLLHGKLSEFPPVSIGDTRRLFVFLLRRSWQLQMQLRGMTPFEMSAGRLVWYIEKSKLDDGFASFRDGEKIRKRQLVGYSDKYKVYWHFGAEARPVIGDQIYMALRPAVIFTADGRTPLPSVTTMHRLRRSFCRSWWNDRWRDMTRAYASFVANGEEEITFPISSASQLAMKTMPLEFELPVSVDETVDTSIIYDIESEEIDFVSIEDDADAMIAPIDEDRQ